MPDDYRVNPTFNACDIIPFAGEAGDEEKPSNLRTNLYQEGVDDGRLKAKGSITSVMAKGSKTRF